MNFEALENEIRIKYLAYYRAVKILFTDRGSLFIVVRFAKNFIFSYSV